MEPVNNSNLHAPGHPVYEPERWNKNKYIRKSHNCYSYALNIIDDKLVNNCKRLMNAYKNQNNTNNTNKNKTNKNKINKNKTNKNKTNKNKTNRNKKSNKPNCGVLKPQPGAYYKNSVKKKLKSGKYTCKKVTLRMIKDNPLLKPIEKNMPCPNNYYLIALSCIPDGSDYHFYRQDASGLWSHKNGGMPARNKDESGNLIEDPEKADRGRYTIFCGYYMVPNNPKLKHMSSRD